MTTTLVSLPGESHGQRSLAGSNLWGHKESDMIKVTAPLYNYILQLVFFFE